MGQIIPTTVMECIPNGTYNLGAENMLRFAPLVSPVMHKVTVNTRYFFVPTRLLWSQWDDWIMQNIDVEAPYSTLFPGEQLTGTMGDHLGLVNNSDVNINVSPMAMAAYLKVWDEYFRDQNLQAPKFIPLTPGDNTSNYRTLLNDTPELSAWMHDYFTACLPFAQKGEEAMIPIGEFSDLDLNFNPVSGGTDAYRTTNGQTINSGAVGNWITGSQGTIRTGSSDPIALDVSNNHTVPTSELTAEAASITNLRRAFRLQEWLEKNARAGTRYVEGLMAHFGARSKDARLQRPEYIGGSRQNMTISEVLSTAQTEVTGGEVPVGQMAGHGISVGGGGRSSYHATEHGYIIGVMYVRPETAYQQGIHKMHTRFDQLDYAWPTFANIGEQAVTGKELYAAAGADQAYLDSTFGYIPRYSEYRYLPSRVSGDMRDTLAYWHLGRIFSTPPQLNEDFVTCDPSRRIFAITDPNESTIYAHIFNNVTATIPLPKYGNPAL